MYCGKLYRRNDKSDDHFRFGSVGNVPRRCLHLYGGNKDEASEREKGNAVGTVYVSVRSRQKEIVRRLELYKEYENLDRRKIRMLTTETALRMVLELYEQKAEA